MRGLCHAETRPAWVVEPLQHSNGRSQLRPKSRWLLDLASPSSALSWGGFVSGSILRGVDPLTLVSSPDSDRLLVQRFPARSPQVPLRAHRFARGLSFFVTRAP